MDKSVTSQSLKGNAVTITYDRPPDECPICHHGVSPKFIVAVRHEPHPGADCQIIFQCTMHNCQNLFISTYIFKKETGMFYLKSSKPVTAQKHNFPELINELSPTFVDIYNQTAISESLNLSQLNGIGLRKALEFLVKDFAIKQNPDKEKEIKGLLLGECINQFLNDPNLKSCAKRAAWLGNDETHYIRKWDDKDIKDLKLLIKLTVNWIENLLLTAKYIEEMPEKNKKESIKNTPN